MGSPAFIFVHEHLGCCTNSIIPTEGLRMVNLLDIACAYAFKATLLIVYTLRLLFLLVTPLNGSKKLSISMYAECRFCKKTLCIQRNITILYTYMAESNKQIPLSKMMTIRTLYVPSVVCNLPLG